MDEAKSFIFKKIKKIDESRILKTLNVHVKIHMY